MRRLAVFTFAVLLLSPAWAWGDTLPYVPPGLHPGDTYQLAFVTSFTTTITVDQTFPPELPFFGNRNDASWIVTYTAYNVGLVPDWDGEQIVWKALMSAQMGTPGCDARDYSRYQPPSTTCMAT